jgi:PTH1 family peptidyl-tRNA hydrolase
MSERNHLIVGLGNPGANYQQTRHNVGFVVVDALVRKWGGTFSSEKWQAWSASTFVQGSRVYVIKPTTFMNLSGRAVVQYADFFRIPAANILVIHDDIDMAPGRLKLVFNGGAGGHNGIRSIAQCLATSEFPRLKIGIGRPGKDGVHAEIPVERFVLSPLADEEANLLAERFDTIDSGIRLLLDKGLPAAMNLLNSCK